MDLSTKAARVCAAVAMRPDLTRAQKMRLVGQGYRPLLSRMIDMWEKEPLLRRGYTRPPAPATRKTPPGKPIVRDLSNTTGPLTQLFVDRSLGVPIKIWSCAKGGVAWSVRADKRDVFFLDATTKQPMRFVNTEAALLSVQKMLMQASINQEK